MVYQRMLGMAELFENPRLAAFIERRGELELSSACKGFVAEAPAQAGHLSALAACAAEAGQTARARALRASAREVMAEAARVRTLLREMRGL